MNLEASIRYKEGDLYSEDADAKDFVAWWERKMAGSYCNKLTLWGEHEVKTFFWMMKEIILIPNTNVNNNHLASPIKYRFSTFNYAHF